MAKRWLVARLRAGVDGLERIVGGLGTSLLALGMLLWLFVVAISCLVGVGFLLLSPAVRAVRFVADRERTRLTRWGPAVIGPPPLPESVREAWRDMTFRREAGWLIVHGTAGFLIGAVGISLPVYAVEDVTFPLWYRAIDPSLGGPGMVWWHIDGFAEAVGVFLIGVVCAVLVVTVGPALARLQALPGRRLLGPDGDVDLSLRVAQLTATRAAALDAHAVELRRIERSLHDGTQNRLVALNVLIGAARRALDRDLAAAGAVAGSAAASEDATAPVSGAASTTAPASGAASATAPASGAASATAEILERAQDATELALAELRAVVRGILPPVLDDRGLAGALAGLAGTCAVPCRVDVDVSGRCAISVEATAYFVVAEALTNVVKHSQATEVDVVVRRAGDRLSVLITDDGRGGADENRGTGLAGMRRRVEAYDGRFALTSPPGGPTTMDVELPCGS